MIKTRWNDSRIYKKADANGVDPDHKYRDRPRTIAVKQAFIHRYLPELENGAKVGKILDISTGTGVFIELLNDLGYEAVGTEVPNCIYEPFHKSQKINVTYHDSVETFPFKKNAFGLVTCIGAFQHYPEDKWSDILKEIFRMAKKTVLVSIEKVEDQSLFSIVPDGWSLTYQINTIYRWDRDLKDKDQPQLEE